MNNHEFNHELNLTNRFVRDIKNLKNNYRKILEQKLVEIANNPYIGKPLRGPLRGKYSERVTKKYRIIYSIPERCRVLIERLYHRETAYANY